MSDEANLQTCPCASCTGHIQFETQHAGETVACPHCQADTILVGTKPAAPPAIQSRKLKYSMEYSGTESKLATMSTVFSGAGMFFLLAAVAGIFMVFNEANALSVSFAISGLFGAAFWFFASGALRFMAEALVMLKKMNGIDSRFKTSDSALIVEYHCANCEKQVKADQRRCLGCGAWL